MNKTYYTKEQIAEAVEKSTNFSQVFRNLSLLVNGGSYDWIKSAIKRYSISTEHFCKVNSALKEAGIMASRRKAAEKFKEPDISTGNRIAAQTLRNYLSFHKVESVCKCCGLKEWMGKPLRLDIDHIDGNPINNSLDNLQFICPNCHRAKTIFIDDSGCFTNHRKRVLKRERPRKSCLDCGSSIYYTSTKCRKCQASSNAKSGSYGCKSADFDLENVISLLKNNSLRKVASLLRISDTGLRKYCIKNRIDFKQLSRNRQNLK